MNWRFNLNPPEDGYYILAEHRIYENRWRMYIGYMHYTVEGGWNTCYIKGVLRKEHALKINDGVYTDGFAWVPEEEMKEFMIADIERGEKKEPLEMLADLKESARKAAEA
jgi:hypothetical protein